MKTVSIPYRYKQNYKITLSKQEVSCCFNPLWVQTKLVMKVLQWYSVVSVSIPYRYKQNLEYST